MKEDYKPAPVPAQYRKVDNIVIHCTATQANATIKSVLDHHLKALKWKTPGYHYIIDKDGNYERAVNIKQVSNGVKGHNHNSIHIAYIGGVDKDGKPKDTRTEAQKETIIDLIKSMLRIYPNARILGHRDFSDDINGNGIIDPWERIKECPCFDAIPEYKNIKP